MTTRPLVALCAAAIVLIACSGCGSCGGCGPLGGCGGDCPYGMQPPHPCAGGCCTWMDLLGAGPHLRQILEPAPCVASPSGHGPAPWWSHLETAGYEMLESENAENYEPIAPAASAPLEPAPPEPMPEFSTPSQPF